jgi:hypothetical protein
MSVELRVLQPNTSAECLICRKIGLPLVRDHNHKTGFVRGRLCETCNTYLGTYESEKPQNRDRHTTKFLNWVFAYSRAIRTHLTRDTGIRYVPRTSGPKFDHLLQRWTAGTLPIWALRPREITGGINAQSTVRARVRARRAQMAEKTSVASGETLESVD